jgi:hypothetical protein
MRNDMIPVKTGAAPPAKLPLWREHCAQELKVGYTRFEFARRRLHPSRCSLGKIRLLHCRVLQESDLMREADQGAIMDIRGRLRGPGLERCRQP